MHHSFFVFLHQLLIIFIIVMSMSTRTNIRKRTIRNLHQSHHLSLKVFKLIFQHPWPLICCCSLCMYYNNVSSSNLNGLALEFPVAMCIYHICQVWHSTSYVHLHLCSFVIPHTRLTYIKPLFKFVVFVIHPHLSD